MPLSRIVGTRLLRLPGRRRRLVVAASVDHLAELLSTAASRLPTAQLLVVVAWWRAPRSGWSGGVGPVERMIRHRVSLPRWGRGSASVQLRTAVPVPLRDLLLGVLPALGGGDRCPPRPARS